MPSIKQFRSFGSFEVRSQDEGIISGYVCKWGDVDSYNTKFKRGCFAKSIQEKFADNQIKLLFNHDMSAMPIGLITELREDEVGLYFEAKLALDTRMGADVHSLIKMDALNRMSFGFSILKDNGFRDGVKEITEVILYEISPVNFPANPNASIDDVRADNFSETLSDNELREKGWNIRASLNETLVDILWSDDSSDEMMNKSETAFNDARNEYMSYLNQLFGAESGLRSIIAANELAGAFNEFLSGRSINEIAMNTNLTLGQCKSLRAGKTVTGADISDLPENVRQAHTDLQSKAATALSDELKALPENVRNDILKPFIDIKEEINTAEPVEKKTEKRTQLNDADKAELKIVLAELFK